MFENPRHFRVPDNQREPTNCKTKHLLDSMDNGIMRINHDSYSMILKEVRKLTEEIEELKGELTLIGFCPIEGCQYHSKINAPIIAQKLKDSSKKLELDLKSRLTHQRKSKFKLPIFMVELQKKSPGFPRYLQGVKNDISFANAAKVTTDELPENLFAQCGTLRREKKSNAVSDDSGTFGFMDAIIEN
ncbi:hypothetical protein TNCV_2256081 [Trichonephila clavipes]|uniref:Uncharacterized protein n=1 Tax=Trichonephila clavipes TaxID=2585209 RepID=A0A8X6RBW7_TRICX|nr:hypothetical protein TNCV_2256081 [Trichonephila clavipes]